MGCGREVVGIEGQPLPTFSHHEHRMSEGPIRWRLGVYADHRAEDEREGSGGQRPQVAAGASRALVPEPPLFETADVGEGRSRGPLPIPRPSRR